MLVTCLREFRDLRTGELHRAGDEFDVTDERLAEINGTAYGNLVRKAPEQPKARRARKRTPKGE